LFEILKVLAVMPAVISGVSPASEGEDDLDEVVSKVQAVRHFLYTLEDPIRIKLEDPEHTTLVDAEDPRSPVADVYQFSGTDLPRVVAYHCMLSLLTNAILLHLVGEQRSRDWREVIHERNIVLSERVWRMHQQAQNLGILWFYAYPTSLVATYESAETDEIRWWIADLMNELHGRNPATDEMWTPAQLGLRCLVLSGRLSHEEVERIFQDDKA
jgi:hypothetical protein